MSLTITISLSWKSFGALNGICAWKLALLHLKWDQNHKLHRPRPCQSCILVLLGLDVVFFFFSAIKGGLLNCLFCRHLLKRIKGERDSKVLAWETPMSRSEQRGRFLIMFFCRRPLCFYNYLIKCIIYQIITFNQLLQSIRK